MSVSFRPLKRLIPIPDDVAKKALARQSVLRGHDGKDGLPGIPGTDGIDGRDGQDGIDGKDGADGLQGIAVDGKDGRDGIDGVGIEGVKGDTGDKPDHEWRGTELRFEKPDGEFGRFVDLRGQEGKGGGVTGGAILPQILKDIVDGTIPVGAAAGDDSLSYFLGE